MKDDQDGVDHNLHYKSKYHIQIQYHLDDMWTNVLKNLYWNQNLGLNKSLK